MYFASVCFGGCFASVNITPGKVLHTLLEFLLQFKTKKHEDIPF